ncbi:hypothetical protein AXG93_1160s1130 [Marchantia polymorpha subsp. ruderalis]|uniref:Uncharacterized protein n=1 Tax=Marchantia polymorpha subsp. ruderalis TaxID=1480154 RepID=A0A176VMB9_MARPO|nr:hypothetical protein AXG93_1160s1130 [Marchantia polymorpha subsp. ruderalis]
MSTVAFYAVQMSTRRPLHSSSFCLLPTSPSYFCALTLHKILLHTMAPSILPSSYLSTSYGTEGEGKVGSDNKDKDDGKDKGDRNDKGEGKDDEDKDCTSTGYKGRNPCKNKSTLGISAPPHTPKSPTSPKKFPPPSYTS